MHTESYHQIFLELLRAGMWGREPQIAQNFEEWGSVVRLAKSQSVLGIVAHVMLTDEILAKKIPQELKVSIKQFVMVNVLTHERLNKTLAQVVSALREGGVESVLLKGQGVARNYPRPELRQCGDIDLYVGPENAEKAHELLAPIADKIDARELISVGKHFHATMKGGVEVEVHRFTETKNVARLNKVYQTASGTGTSSNLNVYDFHGVPVNTPADDFNAYYVFDHLFHHFLTSGVGLRQFCDWMMFLHKRNGKLNQEYLHQLLVDMELLEPWQAMGCVLVDKLGLPEEEFPLLERKKEKKAEKILQRVLAEGNFGKERGIYKNRGRNYLLNKIRSFVGHMEKSMDLVMVFPRPVWNVYKNTMIGGFTQVLEDFKMRFR